MTIKFKGPGEVSIEVEGKRVVIGKVLAFQHSPLDYIPISFVVTPPTPSEMGCQEDCSHTHHKGSP
jgi:hypothetical protein